MQLTAALIRQAIDNNDAVINATVRSYSGRGMSRLECIGVVFEDPDDVARIMLAVARESAGVAVETADLEPEDQFETAMEVLDQVIASRGMFPKVDSLGCDYIAYWPSVPFTDPDES